MKGRAVIFDLDGTLLDTLKDLGDSMNAVLRAHGFPEHPLQAYRYFVGAGLENLVLRALPEKIREDRALVAELVNEMRAEYERRWPEHSRPYPGVPEMLDQLESHGVPKAILSNKPHGFTVEMTKALLGPWSFAAVQGIQPGIARKPNPAAALAIAREMNLPPAEIVFAGDSGLDMQTAAAAGMFAAGVLWGFREAEELREGGARLLLAHPREILDYLI